MGSAVFAQHVHVTNIETDTQTTLCATSVAASYALSLWDWPLTYLEDYHPSVLLHCWLGHLTCKIVSEMTYNALSGTLNPAIPYQSYALHAGSAA